jgi:thioredoxin reductase (NADPH)
VRQPILLLVDDEEAVLDALKGDLARRFGVDYRILAERSPAAGLGTLERLAAASEEVALLVAAQQMEAMTGLSSWCAATNCNRRPSGCCWSAAGNGRRPTRRYGR